jgi:hypothetical protein
MTAKPSEPVRPVGAGSQPTTGKPGAIARPAVPAAADLIAQPVLTTLDDVQLAIGKISADVARQADSVARRFDELAAMLAGLTEQLDGLAERLLKPPAAAQATAHEPVAVAFEQASAEGECELALLGPDLAAQHELADDRRDLFEQARAGDPAALGLLGQLLLFRSATTDRLPVLLKDIGEAYYRWRPAYGDHDPFRNELIAWLERTCAAAGLSNTIEMAHVGDRYDSTCHNARERGVELAAVLGWVVLRDNGKVYTKANVAVK